MQEVSCGSVVVPVLHLSHLNRYGTPIDEHITIVSTLQSQRICCVLPRVGSLYRKFHELSPSLRCSQLLCLLHSVFHVAMDIVPAFHQRMVFISTLR